MRLLVFLLTFHLALIGFSSQESPQQNEIAKIVAEVEKVNALRESLVNAVPQKVDVHTFKAVCKPVGQTAKKIAKREGWLFRQASLKNRNEKNRAKGLEVEALKKFANEPELNGFWLKNGHETHYFRRIVVQKNCLACHGSSSARPEFVKKKYPNDKAFGFAEGDLRGLYHVMAKSLK